MKIIPRYVRFVGVRNGKNPNNDWADVVWNDSSSSWRRVYKKNGRNLILNKGQLYEVYKDSTSNFNYNCKPLDKNENEKILKEIQSSFEEGWGSATEKFGNKSGNSEPFLNYEEESVSNKNPNFEEFPSFEELKVEENAKVQFVDYDKNARHPEHETILKWVRKNYPVYLVGPAGTGKSTVLREIANELNLDFYSTNSIQDEFKLTGFKDASGDYQDTEFYRAFTKGGLFFIDEMDASIPQVLTLLNAAIANRYFEFPNGRKDAHPDFRIVAAGNTFGNGADEVYTGRMVLDQATLDRFVVVEYDYCYDVELAITKGNKWLVDFIHEVRDIANRNGLRTTFSYRALEMISDMEEEFSLEKLFKMTIFKGMDEATINMFTTAECKTKYEIALSKMQTV